MKHSLALCLAFIASALFGQPPVASVPGSVISEDSTAIFGSIVSYTRASKYRSIRRDALHPVSWELSEPALSGKINVARDGSFNLAALPDGAYLICVDVPSGGYLDPCLWSRGIGFRSTLGKATPVGPIVLKKGAILRIRVNDPNRLLPPEALYSASVRVGVTTATGAFYPARLVSQDQTGRDLVITVPFTAPLKFSISSRKFRITDQTGAAADKPGVDVPFSVSAATLPVLRVFNVTGVK